MTSSRQQKSHPRSQAISHEGTERKPADGGRNGICGYVYQAILLLNMVVQPNELSGEENHEDELDALLTLTRPDGAIFEPFDQDFGLYQDLGIGPESMALAQIKYSRQSPPESLSQSDMERIINRLDVSAGRATKQGFAPHALLLVTNRPISPDARKLSRVVLLNALSSPLSTPPIGGEPLPVRVVKTTSMEQAADRLYQRGQLLGATPLEVTHGIDLLVGQTMRAAANGLHGGISRSDFARAITGCPNTQPLTPDSICPQSRQMIAESFARPPHEEDLIIRPSLLTDLDRAALDHAVILLCGRGGCGKTAVLWQWAYSKVAQTPPTTGAFTAIESARRLPERWIARTICAWVGIHQSDDYRRRDEDHNTALDRLARANQGHSGSIMHLGLDGWDEFAGSADRQDRLADLLAWAWEEERRSRDDALPQLNLIVTSRGPDDLITGPQGLNLNAHGFPSGQSPVVIVVDDFDDLELLRAFVEYLPVAASTARHTLGLGSDTSDDPVPLDSHALIHIDDLVLDALRHPAMWGALLHLSAADRLGAVQGQEPAVDELSATFVRRVYKKAHERQKAVGLEEDDFFDLLVDIARVTQGAGLNGDDAWYRIVQQDWNLGKADARQLLKEADSSGLVTREGRSWRWRHIIVWQYLQHRAESKAAG